MIDTLDFSLLSASMAYTAISAPQKLVFTTRFNKIDQEVVNILGKVILEEPVDFSKLQQFIEEAESNVSISPDTFTPVLDYNSYDFSPVEKV